jgi:hypothetical protein
MAKHTSKEAYFERLKNLSGANKTSLKESGIRNLGTLIDYKRGADGIAYGIIKENHHYYLKKAGIKQDPNVADFTYIGGMENITGYQYKSLSEADKQRNMIFHTINEAFSTKVDKNGGNKKRRLHEGDATAEIDKATSKLGDLDAATSAEEVPAEPAAPEGGEEMAAGLDAKPEGGEEIPAPDMGGAPEGGEEMPAPEGGEEMPAPEGGEEMPAPEGEEGGEELPAPEGEEGAPEGGEDMGGGEDEGTTKLQKNVSSIAKEIQTSDLDKGEVKWLLDRFLSAFLPTEGVSEAEEVAPAPAASGENKMAELEIEDRQELADMILNVVPDADKESLADSLPPDEKKPEAGIEEEEEVCAECGSFGMYAESRGYGSPEAFMECDDEEKANVVGGYASAHNDGMNDGDFKTVAIVITPEILQKLKGDYGHDEYAEKLTPYTQEMNESSDEDKMAQLREGWGGLKSLATGAKDWAKDKIGQGFDSAKKAVGQAGSDIKKAAGAAGTAVKTAAGQAGTAIKQAGKDIKQQYYKGEVDPAFEKLAKSASDLAKQINATRETAKKAGQTPPNVQQILKVLTDELGSVEALSKTGKPLAGGAVDAFRSGKNATANTNIGAGKFRGVAENVAVDPANTQVGVPNMLKEEDEEEIEKDEVDVDVDNLDVDDNDEKPFEKSGDKPLEFAPGAQSLGVTTVKPDGAGVEIKVEPDKTVTLSMNESERKIRKYVRARLEEMAGMRKPRLNESKKSPTLKKLDEVIAKQFKLYESAIKKKKVDENVFHDAGHFIGIGKASQGKIRSDLKNVNPADPNSAEAINKLFDSIWYDSNIKSPAVRSAKQRALPQEKYDLLMQAGQDTDGIGVLGVDAQGKLYYKSHTDVNWAAPTPHTFGAGNQNN